MSRCFPFPPPGYEKKIRTDDADPLLKEKPTKEKKHKKEKRDKEKKEGKAKKEKGTSRDERKERKEKKEKHKDRKDKDRDKEKRTTSGNKEVAGVLPKTRDIEKLVTNALQKNGNGESKFIHDLVRRIRNGEEAAESQSSRKDNFRVRENSNSCLAPETNHKRDEEKSENAVLRVSSCTDQRGAKVMVKPLEEKDQAKTMEPQEKNHRKESVTKSDKPLYNGVIKKSEPKNITDGSSKEEKIEVTNKTGQENSRFVEGGPMLKGREHGFVDIRDTRVPKVSKESVKNLTDEKILGKRKDLESNGFLYENGSRPNKMQKPAGSPISHVENGRMLGVGQTPPRPNSVRRETMCDPEVKKHRINGSVDPREPKSRPLDSSFKVKENGEASAKKRPHPDLKYLDQILNIPEKKELDDADEQEWLFGQPGVKLLKKRTTDSTPLLDETPQVWNQALSIDSADIVALPYVVPF